MLTRKYECIAVLNNTETGFSDYSHTAEAKTTKLCSPKMPPSHCAGDSQKTTLFHTQTDQELQHVSYQCYQKKKENVYTY